MHFMFHNINSSPEQSAEISFQSITQSHAKYFPASMGSIIVLRCIHTNHVFIYLVFNKTM